jgi:hypothetical protein
LLFAANAICGAIKEGCELYKQVKEQVVEVIDTANEVKEIAGEVSGFLGLIIKWFKPSKPAPKATPAPKAKRKLKEVTELEVYDKIASDLVQFFNIQQELIAILQEAEHQSQTVYDPEANSMDMALKRVIWRKQIEEMEVTIRELMVYHSPKELGALWTDTQEMREKIREEQEQARQKQLAEQRYKVWQQNQQKGKRELRLAVAVATLSLLGYLHLWWQLLKHASRTIPPH